MKQNTLLYCSLLLVLSSCGKKTFEPFYTTKPQLEHIPSYDNAEVNQVPDTKELVLNVDLKKEYPVKSEDYYNNPGAQKNKNGKAPSVIIAVPQTNEQKDATTDNINTNDFNTDGYYNQAERAIEQALLRQGFNVLDRSKFEAKLRDLRDRANERPWWFSDWSEKLLENGEYDVVKQEYKKQLTDGKITPQQYTEVISEIDKVSQRGLPGKNREKDNQEMTDIAEVIRAAQNGADQADYLFQINLTFEPKSKSLNISDYESVQEFVSHHAGLSYGSIPNQLPESVSLKWMKVLFNAKLIDINSGSIVWLGTYEIESSAADGLQLSFDIKKSVKNEKDIEGMFNSYNTKLYGLNYDLTKLESDLDTYYNLAMKKTKLGNKRELENYTNNLKRNIATAETSYTAKLNEYKSLINNPPSVGSNDWEYVYKVSQPELTPDFQNGQELLKHRKELLRIVTQDLINTIKIIDAY
ncbi:hypothetical protein [Mangrovimonas sp. DI 80]|uniref:hypothetical protein n=1 Tax=Mangrovimonas sp. DI 80 TaxID=1779330 RepID=UPI0009780767|nr:hypothetical protein [Mangrovimonas sp. DI 80]OMP32171.1 hypothetical protein BKM32_03725 [Mangrovimonas sp. DI 80]